MARFFTPAELEREYSPSSCIGGNYTPHLREYAELSAAARAVHPSQQNLSYGGKESSRLDLYLPSDEGSISKLPPLLVFIHGGYWQELSKESSLFPATGCIEQSFAFAAIDYTLAPQASVKDMVLECRTALRWLYENAADLGFDPHRIMVSGSSAGAHLAAMTCIRGLPFDDDLPVGLPAAAVLVSGIYDLQPLVGTSINDAVGLDAMSSIEVSPHMLPLTGFPPAIIAFGEIETDEFKRQSAEFAEALGKFQSIGEVIEVKARNHFNVILDLAEEHTLLGDAVIELMHKL